MRGLSSKLLLRVPGGQRDSARHLAIEGDLERIRPGAGKRDVEHQHRSGLDIHDAGRRLAELHRPSPPSSSFPPSSTNRIRIVCTPISVRRPRTRSTRCVRGHTAGKAREPHVLEYAEDAELALLVDEGVVSDEREVEMQGQATRIEVITSFCLMLLTTSMPCRT